MCIAQNLALFYICKVFTFIDSTENNINLTNDFIHLCPVIHRSQIIGSRVPQNKCYSGKFARVPLHKGFIRTGNTRCISTTPDSALIGEESSRSP